MTNPFNPLKVVRLNRRCPDTALDLQEIDVEEYKKTRDPELLKTLDDRKPTWFHIQKMPAIWVAGLGVSGLTLEQKCIVAFRAAVHIIDRPDGSQLTPASFEKPEQIKGSIHKVTMADGNWFETVCDEFGYDTILEIGQIALDKATLPKDQLGPFTCWVGTVQKR